MVDDQSPLGRTVLQAGWDWFDVRAVLFPTPAMEDRFRVGRKPSWLQASLGRIRERPPQPARGWELARRLSWAEICETWEEGEFDLLLSGAFPAIVPDEVLARARSAVNVHTSLLPELKGRHPHYWAVAWGLKRSGLTAHEMTRDVDQGPVVGQVVVDIPAGTTYAEHYADLCDAVPSVLDQVRDWLWTGRRVEPVPTEPS